MVRNLLKKYFFVFILLFYFSEINGQTAKYLVVSKLTKVMNGSPNPNGVFDTTYGYQIGSIYNSPFSGSYVDGPTVIFRNEHNINLSQFPLSFNFFGYGYNYCLPQVPDYQITYPTQSFSNTCNVDSPKRVDVVSLYLEQPTNNTIGNCDVLYISRPYVPVNTGESNIYATTYQVRKPGQTTWLGISNSNSNSVTLSSNFANNPNLNTYQGSLDVRFGVMVPNGFGGFDWFYSNIITYNVVQCPPKIIGGPVLTHNSCFQSNNGSATFTFDRDLNSGEYFNMTLYKYVNGSQVIYDSQQVLQSQFTNQQYVWSNLGGGTYVFRYQTISNGGSQISSIYSSNPFTINEPSKVTFTTIQEDVVCKNESTGSITVTATGGTAPYQYSKDNGATW